jgi:hypothetical protein
MLNILPTRRWLRFSLRTFLVVVTLFCIWSAWYVHRARRQKEAVEAVQTYGGWAYYDHQFDEAKPPTKVMNESPWPSWLIDIFGIDMFHNVIEVNLVYSDDRGKREETQNTSDEIIPNLEAFPNLRRLYLHSTQVTDDTMPHIARLRKLEEFFVWDATHLSDQGVEYLRNLDRLSSIHISNSRIGDESLHIMSRLPRLQRLSLQGNHFSNKGLQYLRSAKGLKSLWIGLGNGEITDAGAQHLLNLENLEELDLQHYSISSEMQARLKKLPKLKRLHFGGGGGIWFPPSWIKFRTSRLVILSSNQPPNERRTQNETRHLPPLPFSTFGVEPKEWLLIHR